MALLVAVVAWGASLRAEPFARERHPRYYTTPEGMELARRNVAREPWAATFLETARQISARFVAMEPEALLALVPPPGSAFIVGTGLVSDPATGKPLLWGGWDAPGVLLNEARESFPNDAFPDEGPGFREPKTGRLFYFRAAANSEVVRRLEQEVLPALADVYAMSGSQPHAAAAALLLDALAATSAASHASPIDAPQGAAYKGRLGRMNRPTVQVGRALESYGYVIDVIAPSGELAHPSRFARGGTIAAHLAENLLLDGARYALFAATLEPPPGTGRIEALRGAAVAGILLERRELAEPLMTQPGNLYEYAAGMIDRNGFFLENAQAYEANGMDLFLQSADLVESLRRHWPELGPSLYSVPKVLRLFTNFFDRRQVGGHFPATGQSLVDLSVLDPARRVPRAAFRDRQEAMMAQQLHCAWRRLLYAPDEGDRHAAADDLKRFYGNREGGPAPLPERWPVFHLDPAVRALAAEREPEPEPPVSVFYGGKGLALLRSRDPAQGAQLFFGPQRMRGQREALTWLFYAEGAEWSFDPGRHNAHFRYGWSDQSVAHQSVTVDQHSVPVGTGGGWLEAFLDETGVQWALARDLNAYADRRVGDFFRWIAQRESGYWLDVALVEGGKSRDDSFHAAMREARTPPLHSWYLDALSGDRFLGNAVRGDYRITGFKGGFYDMPPGEGYSFLGAPRSTRIGRAVNVTLRNPLFPRMEDRLLHLWLDGAPERELILCDGPTARNHPSLPYLIRRDTGEAPSWFAKVVTLRRGASPVTRFERLPIRKGDGMAWRVTLEDGSADLWFARRGAEPLQVAYGEGKTWETDALCGLVSLDAEGRLRQVRVSRGNRFRAEGVDARFQASLSGTLEAIERRGDGVRLRVANFATGSVPFPHDLPVRVIPQQGSASTWTLIGGEGESLRLRDQDDLLGSTTLTPEKDDWFAIAEIPVGLLLSNRQWNRQLALGKPVYAGERLIGRIGGIAPDGRRIRVTGFKGEAASPIAVTVRELEAGQRFEIPLNGAWDAP